MRRYTRKSVALLLAMLVLGVAACGTPGEEQPQNDNVVGEQTPGDSANAGADAQDEKQPQGDDVAGEQTPGDSANTGADTQEQQDETVTANKDVIGDKSDAADVTENGDKVGKEKTTVVLSDSGITVDGDGCDVREDRLKIEEAGTYEISGTLSDGYIYVNVDNESEVHIILNGVKVHNADSAAFYSKKAAKVTVTLAAGTENVFTDGANYVFEPEEDEPDATFFAKHDLVIEGEGKLKVVANYGDAIKGKDSLYINGGVIEIDAVDDGITGRDLLQITDGTITVRSQSDAIKSSNDVDPTLGNVIIDGGVITAIGDSDDIQAENRVIINGGTLSLGDGEDGIQSGNATEMNGGTVTSVK